MGDVQREGAWAECLTRSGWMREVASTEQVAEPRGFAYPKALFRRQGSKRSHPPSRTLGRELQPQRTLSSLRSEAAVSGSARRGRASAHGVPRRRETALRQLVGGCARTRTGRTEGIPDLEIMYVGEGARHLGSVGGEGPDGGCAPLLSFGTS